MDYFENNYFCRILLLLHEWFKNRYPIVAPKSGPIASQLSQGRKYALNKKTVSLEKQIISGLKSRIHMSFKKLNYRLKDSDSSNSSVKTVYDISMKFKHLRRELSKWNA